MNIVLAMRLMRFFNERPGSTENNKRFYERISVMYPKTFAKMVRLDYDAHLLDDEIVCSARARAIRNQSLVRRTPINWGLA